MADIAIFRINYKSDFILTLQSDAGWAIPFCIKFWTGAPSQAYFVGYDGTTYTHCAPVEGEPTKLVVQFDDHHLPIGDLKFQIGYHFTVADFPTSVEDEVLNQASVIIEVDDAPAQVMLDFNGETAPEIQFSLPAYANEAQRIANEQTRIEAEQQRIANEEARIQAEETRQQNEQQRINQEQARVNEYAGLKADAVAATGAANDAATLANQKAQLAADKAALANDAATLANRKAQLAADKAALANAAAQLANEKAALAQQKAEYAQTQGGYAKDQGDYAKNQGDYAKEQGDTALADHQRAEADHGIAVDDHTQAGNDHTRAESDHGIAVDDHTQAGNDHTRAESDHGIAVDDHTQAGNDHTRAESDHGIAADDHTQAGNDHTRAESDHTRAESDHAAVEVYVDSLGVFDLSKHNAVGSVLATYANLDAALTALNALDSKYKYGGMSFKFVQSSDNNYIQARCMAQNFTTDVTQWQGVDDEPTTGSKNLVESGGVYKIKEELHSYGTVKVSDVISDTYGHKLFDCNIPAGQAIYLKPLLENNDITDFIVYVNGTNSGKYRILDINTSRNGWFVATLDETVTSIWAVCHFSGNNSYRLCYSLDSDIARIDNTVNEMHIKDIEVLSPNKIHIDKKGSDSFDYVMPDITQLNDIYSEYCDHATSFSAFNTLNISTGKKFKLKIEGTASLTRLIFFINGHNDGDDRILDTSSPVIGKWYEFTATKNITSITVATWGTVTSYRVVLHNNNILDELDNNIIISDEFTDQWGHTAFNELTVNKGDTLRFKVIGDATLTRFILFANGINQSDYRLYDDALSLDTWVEVTAGFDITSLSCVVNQGTVTSYQVVLDLGNNVDLTKVKDIFIEGSNLNITKKSGERLIYNPEGSNVLYGKKWAVCGDSFTYGDFSNALEQESEYKFSDGPYSGKYKTYNRLIALRNNMTLQIIARGGRTMATPSVISLHNCFSDLDTLDFGGNYQSIDSDVDYITLYFGINDSHNRPSGTGGDGETPVGEIPIGDVTDNTINTYCGAYNVVLDWLITNRPFAHIGVIISNGCDIDEYRIKTITICEKHGIPYIDMNGDRRTPVMLRSTNPEISASVKAARLQSQSVNPSLNNHPNAKAHNYESYFIEEFLRSI